jgi:deoxynucleoside triphosphate triphosphohydrolase SAMHD1
MDHYISVSQQANEAFQSAKQPLRRDDPTDFSNLNNHISDTAAVAPPYLPPPYIYYNNNNTKKKSKVVNDSIHGPMTLTPEAVSIIDTPQFQRLRRLKQLGISYYVFPGASHNRFEHSLGVAHLAHRFATQLNVLAEGNDRLERGDVKCIELAGLCHDLGHGPFSHVFEREFLQQRKGICWSHEDMSAMMLDYIVDKNNIDMEEYDIDTTRIKAMIQASEPGAVLPSEKTWMYDIVANGRNGIDVDKFDYLSRDSLYCGVKIGANTDRIMQFSGVVDNEICFKYSEYMTLYELFHARSQMHRVVYTHKKAKAVEYMVVDALIEADSVLKMSEKVGNVAEFARLDDNLIDWIENWEFYAHLLNLNPEDEAALRSSQAIINKMRKRQHYKYVSEMTIPQDLIHKGAWTTPTSADIACSNTTAGMHLNADDIILHENKIDFCMKDQNPLDKVHFFDSLSSREKRVLDKDKVSSMVVGSFQDKGLRVYCKNSDPRYVDAVHAAFDDWQKRQFNKVHSSTPYKGVPRGGVNGNEGEEMGTGGGVVVGKRKKLDFDGDGDDIINSQPVLSK